jgi:hypothetical protein
MRNPIAACFMKSSVRNTENPGVIPWSLQPATSFRDVVLGWHMSARESNLSYFRFDGTSYQLIRSAQIVFDEDGVGKITTVSNFFKSTSAVVNEDCRSLFNAC